MSFACHLTVICITRLGRPRGEVSLSLTCLSLSFLCVSVSVSASVSLALFLSLARALFLFAGSGLVWLVLLPVVSVCGVELEVNSPRWVRHVETVPTPLNYLAVIRSRHLFVRAGSRICSGQRLGALHCSVIVLLEHGTSLGCEGILSRGGRAGRTRPSLLHRISGFLLRPMSSVFLPLISPS